MSQEVCCSCKEQRMRIREVAEVLRLHYNTVRNWVIEGKLPATKPSGIWLIHPQDVRAL
jgi:excisionase family DNA binding protein